MKKIMRIATVILIIAGVAVLVGFAEVEHQKTTCKEMEVIIEEPSNYRVIDESTISKKLYERYDSLQGRLITDIDFEDIETYLESIDEVENTEVYSTLTGKVKVKVQPRTPVIRVMNKYNQSYFIDKTGRLMKVNNQYPNRMLLASGNISTKFNDTIQLQTLSKKHELNQLFDLANFVAEDEFLEAQIEQIYVNASGDIELVPKVGRHLIVLGDASDLERKFNKLKNFYGEGMKKAGWNTYKTINLKFKNQVVCEKK